MWIGVITAAAVLIRVVVVLATPSFVLLGDSINYDRMAQSIAQTGKLPLSPIPPNLGSTAFQPPLFSAAMAIPYRLVGAGSQAVRVEAGRLVEALLGAVVVLLIGLIARRLFERRTAIFAAALAAVYPPLVLVGSSLMSESLFIPLTLAATLTALVARDSPHRLRWAIVTGALVAGASLTRANGIALLLPLTLLLWSGRPRLSRRALLAPAAMVLTTIVVLAPWTIRNTLAFHEFVPLTTEGGYALAGTYNDISAHAGIYTGVWRYPAVETERALAAQPTLNEAQLSDIVRSDALQYIGAHPSYLLTVLGLSTLRLFNLPGPGLERFVAPWEGYLPWLSTASVYAFWAVALMALAAIGMGALRRAPAALWGVPLVIILSVVPFEGMTRYRSPVDPFFVILAAAGLLALMERGRQRRLPSAAA